MLKALEMGLEGGKWFRLIDKVWSEKNLRSVELDYQMARADLSRRYGELERALGRMPELSCAGLHAGGKEAPQ